MKRSELPVRIHNENEPRQGATDSELARLTGLRWSVTPLRGFIPLVTIPGVRFTPGSNPSRPWRSNSDSLPAVDSRLMDVVDFDQADAGSAIFPCEDRSTTP